MLKVIKLCKLCKIMMILYIGFFLIYLGGIYMKNLLNKLFFVVFLLIFIFAGYQLLNIFSEYNKGTTAYDNAANSVEISTETVEVVPVVETEPAQTTIEQVKKYTTQELVSLDVDWTPFPDSVIGWIKIQHDDTINYPVVQSEDNEYYLHHLYDGTSNSAGSIFVDYRNNGLANRHVIVYGHNMKNGSMFSRIKKYREQAYADDHRYIYIATPDGVTRMFYIYSCHLTDALGDADGFNAYQVSFDGDEWQKWIAKTQEKSLITSNIEIPEKCNIITLSTCMSRGNETERCVIHAVEVSNQKLVEVSE